MFKNFFVEFRMSKFLALLGIFFLVMGAFFPETGGIKAGAICIGGAVAWIFFFDIWREEEW